MFLKNKSNNYKSAVLALMSVALWSTVATAFKAALSVLPLSIVLNVAILSSFLVLALISIKNKDFRQILSYDRKDWLHSAFLGLLNPVLYYFLLFAAYKRLPAQEALTINYTGTLLVVVFSIIILKQKISYKSMVALLISFFGVIFIANRGDFSALNFSNTEGVIYAILSSLVWGFYWPFNSKDKRSESTKLTTNFAFGLIYISLYNIISGAFADIPIAQIVNPILGLTERSPLLVKLLPAVYIGLFEMGITFYIWGKALKIASNTAIPANLIFLSPFISLCLIGLFVGETITTTTIIGLVIIIIGVILQKKVELN